MPRKPLTPLEKEMRFCKKRLEQYTAYLMDKYRYRNNNPRYKRLMGIINAWDEMIHSKL